AADEIKHIRSGDFLLQRFAKFIAQPRILKGGGPLLLERPVPLSGEPGDFCLLAGSGWTGRAHSLWHSAALARCRLSTLRFSVFATCTGAPSHCRPSAQDKASWRGQTSTLIDG